MTIPTRYNGEIIDVSWFEDIKDEIENGAASTAIKTTDYTIVSGDKLITVDTSTVDITITLPALSGNTGKSYIIKKTDSNAYNVIIDADGIETIDGVTTKTLPKQYDFAMVMAGASEWHIVAMDEKTLTSKIIDADTNTISNLEVDNLKAGVLDTDLTTVSASDDTIPSAKATKAAIDIVDGDLTTHISDTTTHGTTGDIVGISDTQTLTNKTFDDEITQKQIATPSNPSAGYMKLYTKTDGKYYKLDPAGTESELGGGAGGLATTVAYVDDDFEDDVSDYTASAAGLTVSQETTSPLIGDASLKIAKDAVDRSAVYVHRTDFTIDEGYASSVLNLSFVATTSANYADGDMKVIIYDIENSAEIETVPTEILAGENGKFTCTFQTAPFGGGANEGDYELRFVVNSTNASAYDLIIDNILVSPAWKGESTPVTEWEAFTPTGTWTTNTTYTGVKRRVGDTEEYMIKLALSGAPNAVTLNLDIPNTIDTSKTTSSSNDGNFGIVSLIDFGTQIYIGRVYYNTPTTVRIRVTGSSSNPSNVNATSPFTFASSDEICVRFSVPIAGWGVTAQLSEPVQSGTASEYSEANGDFTITSSGTGWVTGGSSFLPYKTANGTWRMAFNFQGAHTVALTGPNFTISGLGVAPFTQSVDISFASTTKSGAAYYSGSSGAIIARQTVGAASTGWYLSGDVALSAKPTWARNYTPGGQQVMAGEKIEAMYNATNGPSVIPAGQVFKALNKEVDTHNAYDTSTGYFTCPKAGTLRMGASLRMAGTTYSTTQSFGANAYLNTGSGFSFFARVALLYGTGGNNAYSLNGSVRFPVNAGDQIYLEFSGSVSTNLNTNSQDNRIWFNVD